MKEDDTQNYPLVTMPLWLCGCGQREEPSLPIMGCRAIFGITKTNGVISMHMGSGIATSGLGIKIRIILQRKKSADPEN